MLDEVVYQIVKNQTINEIKIHIKSIIPSIESFLESRDNLMPLLQFTQVNLLIYQANPLKLFLARLHNQTNLIQHLRTRGTKIEERRSGLAYKRRRISLQQIQKGYCDHETSQRRCFVVALLLQQPRKGLLEKV